MKKLITFVIYLFIAGSVYAGWIGEKPLQYGEYEPYTIGDIPQGLTLDSHKWTFRNSTNETAITLNYSSGTNNYTYRHMGIDSEANIRHLAWLVGVYSQEDLTNYNKQPFENNNSVFAYLQSFYNGDSVWPPPGLNQTENSIYETISNNAVEYGNIMLQSILIALIVVTAMFITFKAYKFIINKIYWK